MRTYTIWDEMQRMQSEMESLLGTCIDCAPFQGQSLPADAKQLAPLYRRPHTDVIETENALVANIELPGVEKNDIRINATEDGIEVKVENAEERSEEGKEQGTSMKEKRFAGFYRQFVLPKHVDASKIEASYRNGVLQLTIPKQDSHKGKPLGIEIKDS